MKRKYDNRKRQEQVNNTRERILDGLVKTMAQGIATLSVPAVAREAGVSVPTVYRHFRTKGELIEALGAHLVAKVEVDATRPPRDVEELVSTVREMYLRAEGLDETFRAAVVSEMGNQLREAALPARLGLIEQALAQSSGDLDERDRLRFRNIVLVLTSSATLRAFKDYLDLSGEEAADNVIWAIRTLVRTVSAGRDDVPS